MKTKTILLLIIAAAAATVTYMCWNKRKEWLSDLGLGTGMLGYNYGPIYEGFELEKSNKDEKKEGFCGACS